MNHLHSFVFPSATGLTAIVRVGWSPDDIFVWRRFHRLVDILRVWFAAHNLPHEYSKNGEVSILFFQSVLFFLKTTVVNSKLWTKCTDFEQQFFIAQQQPLNEGGVVVDDATTQWIFSLLTENPSCVFGAYFVNTMKLYKQKSIETWSNIYFTFPTEDHGIEMFLRDYYSRFPVQLGAWPISYQTAHDLSNMEMVCTKRSEVVNKFERSDATNQATPPVNAVKILRQMMNRKRLNQPRTTPTVARVNLCLKRTGNMKQNGMKGEKRVRFMDFHPTHISNKRPCFGSHIIVKSLK